MAPLGHAASPSRGCNRRALHHVPERAGPNSSPCSQRGPQLLPCLQRGPQLLPLLAGGGREGVKRSGDTRSKAALTPPNPPLHAGEGAPTSPLLAGERVPTPPPACRGRPGGGEAVGRHPLESRPHPSPTLPCTQGREPQLRRSLQESEPQLLPLLAGGGREGVKRSGRRAPKPTSPLPNPPLHAGEGAPTSPLLAGERAPTPPPACRGRPGGGEAGPGRHSSRLTTRSGSPPSTYSRPPGTSAVRSRCRAMRPARGCRPSSAPTRTANAKS